MESAAGEERPRGHRFVLVHGVCHGAWSWYRVVTALRSAGHRVDALDMATCGARPGRAEEVGSFEEYSRPLLDALAALPPGEKAVLVGHSYGGQSLALAMQAHPDRVAVAVFASAAMPAAGKPLKFVSEQFAQERGPGMDSVIETTAGDDPERACKTFLLGPEYMAQRLYQLSPAEDLTLATMLVRPSRRFVDDAAMNGEGVLTAERYGAVSRVYVVAEEDTSWSPEFQRRMASWSPGTEMRSLEGADHMPMFSKSRELSDLLVEIANKYT
ncbi:probable esterase PIR7A [Triticum dicoccoides]|uniref:probable esterase PIR7A n=1 Tax=Triticum dicoccoides TaxID=85692 RepID=UPI000E7D0ABF|nr:probable esterase PIR7A [Triticum dicoccoides]